MKPETFILGDEAFHNAKRSINALKGDVESLYVIINIKKKLMRSKDYIQRIIPITNKINALTNKSVLLITKDDQSYKSELLGSELTEDIFNDIIPLKRLKKLSSNKKNLIKLFKENDYVLVDYRVNKFLPQILGPIFYQKNKKLPYLIQMAKPTSDTSKLRLSKENKLKDDRCDSKYVYKQIKSIVENTSYLPTDGDCLCIKIGMTNWDVYKSIENVNDVINFLIDEKYLPNGGVLNLNQLGNIFVKTSESISLPIQVKEDVLANEDEEVNSDYDF